MEFGNDDINHNGTTDTTNKEDLSFVVSVVSSWFQLFFCENL